jgi:hypothetical protein
VAAVALVVACIVTAAFAQSPEERLHAADAVLGLSRDHTERGQAGAAAVAQGSSGGGRGKLNYASSGNGSLQHATGAMLEQQAGIQMTHIPYKGTGPALTDLLGGQVDLTFGTPPNRVPLPNI